MHARTYANTTNKRASMCGAEITIDANMRVLALV